MTRRQAAVTAAFGLLGMSILSPVAFFYIFPRLIVRSNPEQTLLNITAHPGTFVIGILCYLLTFIADVVVAWALYVFFADVNRPLSQLTAWFRLFYSCVAASTLLTLASVYRLACGSDYESLFGHVMLKAQIQAMLSSFRYGWSFSLLIFSVHLLLLGVLVLRTARIPKVLGILLLVNSAGYIVDSLRPLFFAGVPLPFLPVAFFGELIFMVWLFVRGGSDENRQESGA